MNVYEDEKASLSSFKSDQEGNYGSHPSPLFIGSGADEDVLLKHDISPTSCLKGDYDSSIPSPPSSHIGHVHESNDDDNVNNANVISSSSTNIKVVKRRKYALVTLISVLCIVVIALTIALATSAAKGQSMAAKFSSMKGPPPGVDISQSTEQGRPPPGVDTPEGSDVQGPPAGIDIEGSNEEESPEGVIVTEEGQGGPPPGIDVDEYDGQGPPQSAVDTFGLTEGSNETNSTEEEYDLPFNTTFEVEAGSSSPSPTMSPTPGPSTSPPAVEDTMDEWDTLAEEGACFDGLTEIFCCYLFMC